VPNDSLDLRPVASDVSRAPATLILILTTLVLGLCFNAMPWTGLAMSLRPDALLLLLMFWSLHEPNKIGQGTAFIAGALMDVLSSAQLGQHALGYLVAIFLGQILHVRILKFRGIEQVMHVFGLLLLARVVEMLLALIVGKGSLGIVGLLSVFWLPITWILFHPSIRTNRVRLV
jgi:rod shape-determining protein MreD